MALQDWLNEKIATCIDCGKCCEASKFVQAHLVKLADTLDLGSSSLWSEGSSPSMGTIPCR